MKQITVLCLFLLSYSFISAQDMTVSFNDFEDLSVSTSVKVNLIPGNQNRAEVEIEKGDKEELVVKQSGDEVKIYWKSRNWNGKKNNRQANIDLYYTSLESIDVSAGASVESTGQLASDNLNADVNSGGFLDLDVDLTNFECDVNSGARFEINGVAKNADIEVNSGGSLDADKLKIQELDINANSGGVANVWVTEKIDARANSGGAIKYKGDPKIEKIKKDKWSGGAVVAY